MPNIRQSNELINTIKHWKYISNKTYEPLNNNDYEELSGILDHLLDVAGGDENHELISLVDVISHMISMYDERKNYQINAASAVDALKFLMEQHKLNQSDLSEELGSQGVVSEILNGKRKLNLNQIKKLSQ